MHVSMSVCVTGQTLPLLIFSSDFDSFSMTKVNMDSDFCVPTCNSNTPML